MENDKNKIISDEKSAESNKKPDQKSVHTRAVVKKPYESEFKRRYFDYYDDVKTSDVESGEVARVAWRRGGDLPRGLRLRLRMTVHIRTYSNLRDRRTTLAMT